MLVRRDKLKSGLSKYKPGLNKNWLFLIAGGLWAFAGTLLIHFAWGWVQDLNSGVIAPAICAGVLLALAIYQFGFSKFADKNIRRVDALPAKKPCVFAFQQWTSYPLVVVMISLGIYLRKYSPLPKSILAPMYIGIGGSLLLASWRYFLRIFSKTRFP